MFPNTKSKEILARRLHAYLPTLRPAVSLEEATGIKILWLWVEIGVMVNLPNGHSTDRATLEIHAILEAIPSRVHDHPLALQIGVRVIAQALLEKTLNQTHLGRVSLIPPHPSSALALVMPFRLRNLLGFIGRKDVLDFLTHRIPISKALGLTVEQRPDGVGEGN